MNNKITSARIEIPSKFGEMAVVYGTINGNEVKLFEYFDDELFFSEDEFIGLTKDEAVALFTKKDTEYLRS